MKSIFTLLVICSVSISFARTKVTIPQIMLIESSVDRTLSDNQAVYQFEFNGIYDSSIEHYMDFSIDGNADRQPLTKHFVLSIMTTPGKHVFQFFYNESYFEVYTDSLEIKPKYRNRYEVQLENSIMPIMTEKPVIYLYPKKETEVQVKLDIKGKTIFTYPEYQDGWNFTASLNGDLKFGKNQYNYLFWESENVSSSTVDYETSGFLVKGSEVTSFLEKRLTEAGLNSKEQADFITYWGPRMAINEYNFVHFEFNEACNKYAELDIIPTPDEVYRIYMIWHKTLPNLMMLEQKIEPMKRKGFTVIEWGGQEIKYLTTERRHTL